MLIAVRWHVMHGDRQALRRGRRLRPTQRGALARAVTGALHIEQARCIERSARERKAILRRSCTISRRLPACAALATTAATTALPAPLAAALSTLTATTLAASTAAWLVATLATRAGHVFLHALLTVGTDELEDDLAAILDPVVHERCLAAHLVPQ